jgi:hypothetical protein
LDRMCNNAVAVIQRNFVTETEKYYEKYIWGLDLKQGLQG